MKTNDTKYYLRKHLDTGAPIVVYRFFPDKTQAPEAFTKQHGWRPDADLWLMLMSGDLNEADRVTQQQARELVESWNGKL